MPFFETIYAIVVQQLPGLVFPPGKCDTHSLHSFTAKYLSKFPKLDSE